jgi:hypothetical protein
MVVEREKKERREKVNDYSGTIVSERRLWRMHTLGTKKSMIIVVPLCLKDADGARTRSDQNQLPGLPGSALKVSVGGGVEWHGVGQPITLSIPT